MHIVLHIDRLSSNQPRLKAGDLLLSLTYGRAEVVVREEFYAYDFNNFIADVGGFLGLLLGQSVVSLVDGVTGALRRAWPKKSKVLDV